ncbi:hypothetical protein YC2023_076210 [Brassica napus]
MDECTKIGRGWYSHVRPSMNQYGWWTYQRRRDLKPWSVILSLKPFLSVPDGESLIGSKGGWRGVMNLKPKLLVQELVTSGYKKDEVK